MPTSPASKLALGLALVCAISSQAPAGAAAGSGQSAARPVSEERLSAAVVTYAELLRPQLPIREGALTITGAAASGTTLVLDITSSAHVTPEGQEALRQQLQPMYQRALCSVSVGAVIEHGGTILVRLIGQSGPAVEIRVASCPPAPAG